MVIKSNQFLYLKLLIKKCIRCETLNRYRENQNTLCTLIYQKKKKNVYTSVWVCVLDFHKWGHRRTYTSLSSLQNQSMHTIYIFIFHL